MTRKQYIRRINELTIAAYKHAGGKKVNGDQWKVGISLKYNRDHAKEAPEACVSYQAAWDNLKSIREMYGIR